MKTIKKSGAQGDLFMRRIAALPTHAKVVLTNGRHHVLGHSETGHHHVVDAAGCRLFSGENPQICYLLLETVEHADVIHLREWHTHETIRLDGGPGSIFEITRQREYTPEGWRRVQD